MAVVAGVSLPSIDEPRFDLQFVGGEPLQAHAVEIPGSVGGYKGGLIGPVVEVIEAEQADIGGEDSGVQVEPVIHVEMVASPSLGNVAVGLVEGPLSDARAAGAGVVARGRAG